MKLKIITIGEPKLSFAKMGFNEYTKRLNAFHSIEVTHLKNSVDDKKILNIIDNVFCIILDERGKQFTSKEFAKFIEKKSVEGVSKICFMIGGPDGHSKEIKDRADMLLSFGKMTLPHDLAMVVLAESLYRASTININHPYHRS